MGGLTMASVQYGLPNFAALDKNTSRLLIKTILEENEPTDFSGLVAAAKECEESIKAERKHEQRK